MISSNGTNTHLLLGHSGGSFSIGSDNGLCSLIFALAGDSHSLWGPAAEEMNGMDIPKRKYVELNVQSPVSSVVKFSLILTSRIVLSGASQEASPVISPKVV